MKFTIKHVWSVHFKNDILLDKIVDDKDIKKLTIHDGMGVYRLRMLKTDKCSLIGIFTPKDDVLSMMNSAHWKKTFKGESVVSNLSETIACVSITKSPKPDPIPVCVIVHSWKYRNMEHSMSHSTFNSDIAKFFDIPEEALVAFLAVLNANPYDSTVDGILPDD
jgi:hypothetical protein